MSLSCSEWALIPEASHMPLGVNVFFSILWASLTGIATGAAAFYSESVISCKVRHLAQPDTGRATTAEQFHWHRTRRTVSSRRR